MAQALDQIASIASGGQLTGETVPWGTFRYQHAQAIRASLQESVSGRTGKPLSVASINKHLCALRGVLREAWRLGLMTAEDYHRAVDLEPVRGNALLRGRALEENEIAALFHVCQRDSSARGPRDASILALGLMGLRRSETASLAYPNDLSTEDWVLRVHGKGSKLREVPVKNGCIAALRAWISRRGHSSGPLLCPIRKGGKIEQRALSPEAIYRICAQRGLAAGIQSFTPHDLRRTFVSTLLDRGVDLSVVAKLTGHAGLDTVALYDRRDERARHDAAETITLPYFYQDCAGA